MTKKPANLITKPVAWTGDKPTKYQSFLEYPLTEERAIRVFSIPKPTEKEAYEDLRCELQQWEFAIKAFRNLIPK